MTLSYDYHKILKSEFRRDLLWFEEEFDLLFNGKSRLTKREESLANQILDILSETINAYPNEKLLTELVYTLNNIEKKHPEIF
ncbi:MAG: hypothetical protein ACFFAQ_11420 [Promethearchaeota archaeon]